MVTSRPTSMTPRDDYRPFFDPEMVKHDMNTTSQIDWSVAPIRMENSPL